MPGAPHTDVNEFERLRWNDQRWTEAWPKREALTEVATEPLLGALMLKAGERLLDVGSGAGAASLEAARQVGPTGLVVGADVSVALTDFARRRAAASGIRNVGFLVADTQVDRIEGAPFDVAMSQFGVMFFDEPAAALTNIRANLVAGARLSFASWLAVDENPWYLGPVLAEFVVPPPPPAPGKHATGPFAFSDLDEVAALLAASGWVDVSVTQVRTKTTLPRESIGDDEGQLRFLGVADERFERARREIEEYLRQFRVDDAHVEVPVAFAVVSARTR